MEQRIGEAMDGMMNLQPKQSECALTLRQRELAREVTDLYGAFDNVLGLFAPKYQGEYTLDEYRCHFGTAPMLNQLHFAYGKSAPIEWLSYQIIDLNRYANCKMMTDYQVKSLAHTIYKEYYFLKLTEVMLFFHKVKSAEYGQLFFGAVDPIPLMVALKKFAEERAEVVRKKENEEARAERERNANRPDILKPHEVQALRERLQAQWAEEDKLKQQNEKK